MEHANATQEHILLVEDVLSTRENLTHILEKAGFRVTAPTDGEIALEFIKTGRFDLVLLDIDLHNWGMDGRKLLHNIRDDGDQTPVILLTAVYISEVDEIVGFAFGADDYIRKTVSSEVLVARIRGLLRRTRAGKRPLARFPKLNAGPARPLVLGRRAKDAFLHGRALHLKRKPFELLECLMLHPDEVMSREEILYKLPASWINDPRIIDRHMAPLRKALGDDPKSPTFIETVHSEGYRFIGPVEGEE
jgi:two-component system, OmpR family, response regulator RegX3